MKKRCTCNRRRLILVNAKRRRSGKKAVNLDPTRTITLRRRFQTQLNQRWRRLRLALVDLIVKEDAFGLEDRKPPLLNFDPSEPRDEQGRWTSDGGAEGGGSAGGVPDQLKAEQVSQAKTSIWSTARAILRAPMSAARVAAMDAMAFLAQGKLADIIPIASDYAKITSAKPDPVAAQFGLGANDLIPIATAVLGKAVKLYQRLRKGKAPVKNDAEDPNELDLIVEVCKLLNELLGRKDQAPPREQVQELILKRKVAKDKKAPAPPTANVRWRFNSTPEQVKAFQEWLKAQLGALIVGKTEEEMWRRYTEAGFRKGAGRAFDDVKSVPYGDEKMQFWKGTKDQFLRDSFAKPVAVEKVQLLAGRAFDELKGVTSDMSLRMSRVLTDGLVRGESPRDIASSMEDEVDVSSSRALTIARTEIVRAHAEGQLVAMKNLGVEEVGVAVEWSTAEDELVCEECEPLQGVVMKLEEAEGMLPRHPNCRCAWIPANVGEDGSEQKSTKGEIDDALEESTGGRDSWGPGKEVSASRPEPVVPSRNQAEEDPLEALSRWVVANDRGDFFRECSRDDRGHCEAGEGGSGGGSPDRSKYVGAKVDGKVHAHAEKVKHEIAQMIGGIPEEQVQGHGQKDKKPFDVRLPLGNINHDVEVKSMSVGAKQSLSVHDDALLRKVEHVKNNLGTVFHTVAVDDRGSYEGGINKENYSGNRLYYKRGSGAYSLKEMHPVKDEKELAALIKADAKDLPPAARGKLPPPPPLKELKAKAKRAAEGRKARDKARKERNRDLLREQAKARREKAKLIRS